MYNWRVHGNFPVHQYCPNSYAIILIAIVICDIIIIFFFVFAILISIFLALSLSFISVASTESNCGASSVSHRCGGSLMHVIGLGLAVMSLLAIY